LEGALGGNGGPGRLLYRIAAEQLLSDDPEITGKKVEKAGASGVADGL
jgi:hypothetical protein